MEEKKPELPVLITAGAAQLKMLAELPKVNLTLPQLEERALKIVKNRDNLTIAKELLADIDKGEDMAEKIFKKIKKPFWDAGKACDEGKKLVSGEFGRIRGMIKPWYDKTLADVAEETRLANLKAIQDKAILDGIEANLITFSNMIIAAVSKKQLLEVESRINLEKSPSMAKKYGEFHARAIERYDSILLPIVRDQKIKVGEIEKLNEQLLQAEANNDPDKMDELMARVDEKSNEILQNHAVVQDAVLNQESFPVMQAEEVLPDFKVKRTNSSFEIVDVEKAFKHMRSLLEITINGKAAREEFRALMENGEFEGKDEVIKHGIKFTAVRVREAL